MRKSTIVVLGAVTAVLGACATKTKLMDASAVSMTHYNVGPDERMEDMGPVNGKFCPDMAKDKGNIGLIDEATRTAQRENNVDIITNVSIWREMNGCLLIDGTGQKLVKKSNMGSEGSIRKR